LILQTLLGEGGAPTGVIGSLARLSGSPLGGAAVAIQQRAVSHKGQSVLERTVAQTATDGAGRFQVPLILTRAHGQVTALRAVFAGAPGVGACVSDPLELAGKASFAAPPVPASLPSGEGAPPHAA
jgi:hypothetical protein